MTAYVICTAMLGGIAIWQHLVARAWRDAAETYRSAALKSVDDHKRTASCLELTVKRIECIRLALPAHYAAAAKGDARECNRVLYAAIQAGNALIPTEPTK